MLLIQRDDVVQSLRQQLPIQRSRKAILPGEPNTGAFRLQTCGFEEVYRSRSKRT
jgi:hypothetical protein